MSTPTRTVWTRRDPFAEFDSLIARTFGPSATRTSSSAAYAPSAETFREGADAVVRLDLPGIDPAADVTVEVVNGRLVVRGERRDQRAESTEGRTVREVRYGSFERTFRLPVSAGADDVTASYDAGVLTVRVAGAYAGAEPWQIAVTTGAVVQADDAAPDDAVADGDVTPTGDAAGTTAG